jgi:hypothetical protein
MPHAYTEDHLVEQPAIALFADPAGAKIRNLRRTNNLLLPCLPLRQINPTN